jgi:cobalt-zinc-cadmium efflux system protein
MSTSTAAVMITGKLRAISAGHFGRAFAVGITLNLVFVGVEVVYGILSRSMALLADDGHNLSDVLGLALSWGAAILAKRRPTTRRTYGYRSTTILASLTNALVLLFVTGGIAWESVRRLFQPGPVEGRTVIVVALVGVAINASSAALFMAGRKGDLNVRSAFLHLASDAALALGVAVAGTAMLFTGWQWLDPAVSIALSLFILVSTGGLLRGSLNLVLDAVPEGINPDDVRTFLATLPGVIEVHDLHIWAMGTTDTALTAHLVIPSASCHPSFIGDVCDVLHDRFAIDHSTLQVETPEAPDPCRLAAEGTL